jgi:hypothetical protein
MCNIWSAVNPKVKGGGIADEGFLRALPDLTDDDNPIHLRQP